MQELEVTWGRVLSVWWLIVWRGTVGGMALGLVGGFVAGFICDVIGHVEWAGLAGGVTGLLLGVPWALVVIRMALKKRYADFRIALVPREVA